MKLAYLINQYPKPSHTFIRREIEALERLGVEVVRISIRGWKELLVDNDDIKEQARTRYVLKVGIFGLLISSIRVFSAHPINFFRALRCTFNTHFAGSERPLLVHFVYLAEACQILIWLQESHAQHIHAHFGTNSAEVAMLVNKLGGPSWSMTVHGPAEFDRKPLLNLTEKILRSKFVVAISSYGRSQLYRAVGFGHWNKIHVVHCGLDASFFRSDKVSTTRNKQLVCIGRLSEAKGQLLLIEAVRVLRDRGEFFELVLAGDGELRPHIQDLIDLYNLNEQIRLVGWISNDRVKKEILDARALVMPSFAEGLPVAIMEAMALGRPVIATFVAGIPELVISGKNGWLIPAGDLDLLVQAILEVLEAPEPLLVEMGEAATRRVYDRHNIDVEAKKLLNLFTDAVA